jgi:hypothetical protein
MRSRQATSPQDPWQGAGFDKPFADIERACHGSLFVVGDSLSEVNSIDAGVGRGLGQVEQHQPPGRVLGEAPVEGGEPPVQHPSSAHSEMHGEQLCSGPQCAQHSGEVPAEILVHQCLEIRPRLRLSKKIDRPGFTILAPLPLEQARQNLWIVRLKLEVNFADLMRCLSKTPFGV